MSTRDISIGTDTERLSLKERQRLEREELIICAAEALLAEKGYHAIAMDEIATRVGIAKGTVYLHFPSKEDLVVALFERELSAFRHVVEDATMAPGLARARLEQILSRTYEGMRSGRTHLLITLAADPSVRNELLEKRLSLRDHIAQVNSAIQRILEDGKTTGEFDQAIPTVVMLTTFLGLLSPRHFEPLLETHCLSPEELANHAGRIFFTGITHH